MNDLNLRVSGGVGVKVKKPMAPITMSSWNTEQPGAANNFIKEFLNSKSADGQLKCLKQYLNNNKEFLDEVIVEFLVLLFWGADAKHPVKGFLKKHVTESQTLEEPFTQRLIEVIKDEIKGSDMPYGSYIGVMTRLDACIDKFPPGAKAVSVQELDVAIYFLECLESCVATLSKENGSDGTRAPLAPTEINKIYDLAHLTLRLLLYIIQKVTDGNRSELSAMFGRIRAVTMQLMEGKEVPMDTKTVSGIVQLNLHMFENGPDSWVELVDKEPPGGESGTVELCLYSAVATAVPRAALAASPALTLLTDRVLDIGDRYTSSASHSLAVARTVLAISKTLGHAPAQGARLAAHCWPRLDHPLDSVRHLANQALGHVVAAAVRADSEGDPSALDDLFSALESLGDSRGAWAARALLAARLGPRLLARAPALLPRAAAAARRAALQAAATLFLETLLERYTREASPQTVYEQFVRVVLDAAREETEPSALAVLQNVLAKAVHWDRAVLDYILPDMDELYKYEGSDLKCILLVLGVVRKSDATFKYYILSQLRAAAYNADDEIRILALSLVSACPSLAAPLEAEELDFVLSWLRYNFNAQAPAFRALMMAHMKKILRRLENSVDGAGQRLSLRLRAAAERFVCELRARCCAGAGPAAAPARRAAALQLLAWQARLARLMYSEPWSEERAELIYNVLEDTYEANKALALEILKDCPSEYISKIEGPFDECLERLVRRASSVKPAQSAAAAYKLQLLCRRAPDSALDPATEGYPERGRFATLARLAAAARAQAAARGPAAPRHAPVFGVLHCAHRLISTVDAQAIAGHPGWSGLVDSLLAACREAGARAEPVVCAASPEGLLPDHPDSCSEDDEPVTAQMVLMCAWRTVKETSLILGTLVARLALEGEAAAWTLGAAQAQAAGAALAGLLARARHRGAFEQAAVGLAALLARLWKCKSARLYQLPLRWFEEIERDFLLPTPPEGATEYCATRRGAGLPFMIQVLVTTELAAEPAAPRGRLLARCLELCLAAAEGRAGGAGGAARAHLVLRALFRHAEPGAGATARAIMLAVRGFDADNWMERNSATLLFAALATRVFGVARARGPLCARNRMTGRIFFLRYPELYDFLLEQLKSTPGAPPRPSLCPTLLLLARLYPSALEGTVSNLKLERFVPLVGALAGAADLATRRLAARALPPLVAAHRYVPYIQSLFDSLSHPDIKTNLCHGILCQLAVLLEEAPGPLGGGAWAAGALRRARRLAAAACCPVADQYLAVLRLLLLRFPEPGLLDEELAATGEDLSRALFAHTRPRGAAGREPFLANAAHMLLLILTAGKRDVFRTTVQCLEHPDYEVQLSALNYLLALHGRCEDSNAFLDHLSSITESNTLTRMREDPKYLAALAIASKSLYAECAQKALELIMLAPNYPDTQCLLVQLKLGTPGNLTFNRVVEELLDAVRDARGNLRHVYLSSVVQLVSQYKRRVETFLPVLRTLHEHCSAANDERSRAAVVTFLELNYALIMGNSWTPVSVILEPVARAKAQVDEKTEARALATAMAAILLEDDDPALRARTAVAVCAAHSAHPLYLPKYLYQHSDAAVRGELVACKPPPSARVLPTFAAQCMRYRVFDQNEIQNVYLEEFTWTVECAKIFKTRFEHLELCNRFTSIKKTIEEYVASVANEHRHMIEQLCIDDAFLCFTERKKSSNPKMDLFWKTLHE